RPDRWRRGRPADDGPAAPGPRPGRTALTPRPDCPGPQDAAVRSGRVDGTTATPPAAPGRGGRWGRTAATRPGWSPRAARRQVGGPEAVVGDLQFLVQRVVGGAVEVGTLPSHRGDPLQRPGPEPVAVGGQQIGRA